MKVQDVAEVRVDFPEAHFWLVRSHSRDFVGKPTKVFKPDYIGIKVTRLDLVNPDFFFLTFQVLHTKGVFALTAHGSLGLVHIRVSDVGALPIEFR